MRNSDLAAIGVWDFVQGMTSGRVGENLRRGVSHLPRRTFTQSCSVPSLLSPLEA